MAKNKTEKQQQCTCAIGGQALIEGVMMQSKTSQALAVRNEQGFIEVKTRRFKPNGIINKIPIVRGCVAFIKSLINGTKLVYDSAEVAYGEEDSPGGFGMTIATILGLALAVGLFFVLPSLIVSAIEWIFQITIDKYIVTLVEGGVRLLIFILYLLLVSLMKDIKRTFMYHGAEHRTINCFEHGMELTVQNVQSCSTRHNRCGTTFLFIVMISSIILIAACTAILSACGLDWFVEDKVWRLVFRLGLLPIIAGVSYEILQGMARLPDNWFVNALRAPGLAMQRLTTFEPEPEMAEVAILAFNTVLKMDANPDYESSFGTYPIAQMRTFITKKLADTNADESEADWILCEVLSVKRGELATHAPLDKKQFARVCEIIEKRKELPLDYVLGKSEFYGVTINVSPAVLIPEPDTEIVVEAALKHIKSGDRVLDLMCGSGCIARAISENCDCTVVASDISEQAIEVAKTNFSGTIIRSDALENIEGEFDVIVSNPPYIKSAVIDTLTKEVRSQPRLALDGGEDGLDLYRKIASGLSRLKKSGVLVLEIGYDQAESVTKIFENAFESVSVIKDLEGNDRVVVAIGKN